jgi:hypothetical protein
MFNVSGSATVTTQVGVDIETLTEGGTNLSLRSSGTSVEMRHAGPARFGSSTAGPTGASVVHIDGGLTVKRTTVADIAYTVLTSDYIVEYTSLSAARTITLPAAATASAGKVYVLKNGTSNTSVLTVDPSGAELIDGAATKTFNGVGGFGAMTIYCTGANWMSV